MVAIAKPEVVIVVHTIVRRSDGAIVLLRRFNTGYKDGYFALPGGHVKDGESIAHAAVREVREESTLEVCEIKPAVVMPFKGGVDFIFEAVKWEGNARIGEPEKCSEIDWFCLNDLPTNVVAFVPKAFELIDCGIWYHEFTE